MRVLQIFYISIIILTVSLMLSFFLHKKKKFIIKRIDKLIVFLGALVLTALSLLVMIPKNGGTIMSTAYGWPHFYLIHYIRDMIDGTLIGKWNFISGGLFMYPLVNFIFYLSVVLLLCLTVRFFIQSEKKITVALLVIITVLATSLISSQKTKELYIKHEIKEANYCQVDSDCKDAGNKCPFGCSTYVNKNEAARINRLINSFYSNCSYDCLRCANFNIKCESNKCQSICGDNKVYQEIETNFGSKYLFGEKYLQIHWKHDMIDEEKNRLKKIGTEFFHENSEIMPTTALKEIKPEIECGDTKESCRVKNIVYPEGFTSTWAKHYELGDDQYDVLLDEDYKDKLNKARYCIFKNQKEFFCLFINTGAEGPIIETVSINDKPAFTFLTAKKGGYGQSVTNILFDNALFNNKYNIDRSYNIFSFKDNIGFIAVQGAEKFIFINGEKASQGFDEIMTNIYLTIPTFPFEIYDNGVLFFIAKRGEKYFFIEIDIEKNRGLIKI